MALFLRAAESDAILRENLATSIKRKGMTGAFGPRS